MKRRAWKTVPTRKKLRCKRQLVKDGGRPHSWQLKTGHTGHCSLQIAQCSAMYSAHKARQPEDCMLQCTTQKVLACSTALFCSVLGSLWTVSVQCSCGTWYWQFCAAMLRIKGDVCVTTLVHLYKGLLSSIQCCCGLWYLLLAKYYWVLDTYSSMQRCCGLWDISTTLVL